MSKVQIDAAPRTEFGKGAARQIRRDGRVPAVVYGGGIEVQHVSLPGHDLMMALKTSQVILEVNVGGDALNVAPRQVQKDPIRGTLEHVDLIVLTAQEVRERLVVGAAVAKAEKVAAEEELDQVTLVMAVRELLDEGIEADEAIAKAVENVREQMVAQAAAAIQAAAAEEAKQAASDEAAGASDAAADESADAGAAGESSDEG